MTRENRRCWIRQVAVSTATLVLLIPCFARAQTSATKLAEYDDQVDQAIDRGLAFLAGQQVTQEKAQQMKVKTKMKMKKPDLAGSFQSFRPGITGITSLSVMAFLSKGHTPGYGPYGELINHGLDYILSQQHENGLLVALDPGSQSKNGLMYSHSISTLLLAEASGMVDSQRQSQIDIVLPKALALLLNAQQVQKPEQHAGGWRYRPNAKDSDLSLTGWAIMALRAGKLNGAPVPAENIDDAIEYVFKCRNKHDGGFGYQPVKGVNIGLTGCAVLCMELCGRYGHEFVQPAGDYILSRMPKQNDKGMRTYYAIYYCSQATFQLGDKYWETWAPNMYDLLLQSQQTDGSWPGGEVGPTFNTAMSVLAMTVSYRQLPIYQRDESDSESVTP